MLLKFVMEHLVIRVEKLLMRSQFCGKFNKTVHRVDSVIFVDLDVVGIDHSKLYF